MKRTFEETEVALRCLELANSEMLANAQVVERAEAFYAFATGQTPRETINAALDRAGVK